LKKKKEKAENYNLYIKNELQKESFCENDDLGTYSTDSLGRSVRTAFMSLIPVARCTQRKGDTMLRILCTSGLLLLVLIGCKDDSTRPVPKRCPSGTVKWRNGHCYEAVLVPVLWSDAKTACEARGGHLVTIGSAEENAFVFSLVSGINAFWYLDSFGNGLGPWLGGYQEVGSQEPDGGWKWVTGDPFVYTNWEVDQPDNSGGAGGTLDQNCIRFFKKGGLIGDRWDDCEAYNPVEHRRGYICEYE